MNSKLIASLLLVGTLSVFTASCSNSGGDLSNSGNQEAEVISEEKEQDKESSPIVVTEENFPQAYSNMRFDAIIKQAGGINKFLEMPVASSDPAKQFVVRMNRDTFYSTSVFDMTGGIYVTIPETDQYVSIQVVDENHETQLGTNLIVRFGTSKLLNLKVDGGNLFATWILSFCTKSQPLLAWPALAGRAALGWPCRPSLALASERSPGPARPALFALFRYYSHVFETDFKTTLRSFCVIPTRFALFLITL